MTEPTDATRRFSAKRCKFYRSWFGFTRSLSGVKGEKGYEPLDQIVGYLLSGDPTYITSYRNARVLIKRLERDQILEELVTSYLEKNGIG